MVFLYLSHVKLEKKIKRKYTMNENMIGIQNE